MAALALLLALVPAADDATRLAHWRLADVIEVNNFGCHDDDDTGAWQVIYWRLCPEDGRYHVLGWRWLHGRRPWPGWDGGWRDMDYQCGKPYGVRAERLIETRTGFDAERLDYHWFGGRRRWE